MHGCLRYDNLITATNVKTASMPRSLDVGLASFFESGCAAPLDFKTSWLLEACRRTPSFPSSTAAFGPEQLPATTQPDAQRARFRTRELELGQSLLIAS